MRWHALLWLAVLGMVAVWAPMTLDRPFFRDHGTLAWAGHVVAEGGLPYRDAFDVKGPLVYYVYAVLEGFFGVNQWGIRAADLVVVGATAVLIVLAGLRFGDRVAAGYAACIYLVHHVSLEYDAAAQPDGWASLPVAAALLCLSSEGATRSAMRLALAGGLISLAALIKPTFALLILAPLAAVFSDRRAGAGRATSNVVLGFLLPAATAVAWFAARGALADLIDVQIRFNLGAYSGLLPRSPTWHATEVLEFLGRPAEAIAVALAIVGGYHQLRERTTTGTLLVAALAASAASVAVQQKYFVYHWQAIFVPLALLGGLGLASLWIRERVFVLTAGLLVLLVPLRERLWEVRRWQQRTDSPALAQHFDAAYMEYGDTGFRRFTDAVVGLLRSRATPQQRLLVWGHQPGINYRTGLETPTRFGYSLPLVVGRDTSLRRRYRAQFHSQIRATPPKWVIVVADESDPMLGGSSPELLREVPEFAHALEREYVLDTTLGPYDVFVRRESDTVMLGGPPTSED